MTVTLLLLTYPLREVNSASFHLSPWLTEDTAPTLGLGSIPCPSDTYALGRDTTTLQDGT